MIPEALRDIYVKVLKRRWGIKAMREDNTIFVWLIAHNKVKRSLSPQSRAALAHHRAKNSSNDCSHILEP